jgi:CorA-like Mg2+ transporter protein
VSKQSMAEELFKRLTAQLGTDALFDEVRAEVLDMNSYLDSDATRRQGEIVLRLTVVTILGLVGTLVTGFLGMNLIDAADAPLHVKALYVAAITLPAVLLTAITVQKSGALADVMDTLANERLEPRAKLKRAVRLLRGSARSRGAPL